MRPFFYRENKRVPEIASLAPALDSARRQKIKISKISVARHPKKAPFIADKSRITLSRHDDRARRDIFMSENIARFYETKNRRGLSTAYAK